MNRAFFRILFLTLAASFTLFGIGSTAEANGRLQYVICDIKRPLSGRQGALNENNYKSVIDAFKSKLKCNGIRIHIDALTSAGAVREVAPETKKESYRKLYRDVYAYARSRGLLIYANLLPVKKTLEFGGNSQKWGETVGAYVKHFCPDFVGPFNENGANVNHVEIVAIVRKHIPSSCKDPFGNTIQNIKIVGPDSTRVGAAMRTLKREPQLAGSLDIVSAHSNVAGNNSEKQSKSHDRSANAAEWQALQRRAGKPVWASEAAAAWTSKPIDGRNKGQEVGLKSVMDSGAVSGIVIYNAFVRYLAASAPNGSDLEVNEAGKKIVRGLESTGWKYP